MNKKRFSLTSFLAAILIVTVAITLQVCFRYVQTLNTGRNLHGQVQMLQARATQANQNLAMVRALLIEVGRESETNPAVNRIVNRHEALLRKLNLRSTTSPDRAASQ